MVMDRRGPPKRMRNLVSVPDDVLHVIFALLEFRDKISAGLVCKQWDHLLKAGSAAGRHWVVVYDVERLVSRPALTRAKGDPAGESMVAAAERCVTCFHLLGVHAPCCAIHDFAIFCQTRLWLMQLLFF
jgi:hypothetical protein